MEQPVSIEPIFKNDMCIFGELHHLQAFCKDIKKIGYSFNEGYHYDCHPDSFDEKVNSLHLRSGKYAGQIIESYDSSSNYMILQLPEQWKEALEAAAEKEQFKEGMWVKYISVANRDTWMSNHPTRIFRAKQIKGQYLYPEPDAFFKEYERGANHHTKRFVPATEDEIKDHLVFETKARGVEQGAAVDRYWTDHQQKVVLPFTKGGKCNFAYSLVSDILSLNGWIVYEAGKWVKVVEKAPRIITQGYTGVFSDENIAFGEAVIDKDIFLDLVEADEANAIFYSGEDGQGTGNVGVTGVLIGNLPFSLKQVRKIAKYYKDKSDRDLC